MARSARQEGRSPGPVTFGRRRAFTLHRLTSELPKRPTGKIVKREIVLPDDLRL
jgi:hypothetical protein